jgi:hypothetical protein
MPTTRVGITVVLVGMIVAVALGVWLSGYGNCC